MTDFQSLYQQKLQEFNQLSQQFNIFQSQSNELIEELQAENIEVKRKLQVITREHSDMKEKRKVQQGALERELEQCKKDRNEFQAKFIQNQKKIVELDNVVEALESENRASQYMLSEYEERVEKTMEELAMLQLTLQESQQDSEETTARLKTQLKETEEELYVIRLKHQKHNDESQSRLSMIRPSCIKPSVMKPNFVRKDTTSNTRSSFMPQQSYFGARSEESSKDKKVNTKVVEDLNRIISNLEREISQHMPFGTNRMSVTA